MNHTVEICVSNLQSAINAQKAGAKRIELCSALQIGGITPTKGFVEAVVKNTGLKVNVLIRPRGGNFVYSKEEFEIICNDISELKETGINGIVCGILLEDGSVDIERSKQLAELSRPLEFTFHRAIDNSPDTEKALKDIIKTGADRVLTSGGKPDVNKGMTKILNLQKKYGDKIIIMPGGGINEENAQIFLQHGIKEVHLSAGKFEEDKNYNNPELGGMGHYYNEGNTGFKYSNPELIRKMLSLKS